MLIDDDDLPANPQYRIVRTTILRPDQSTAELFNLDPEPAGYFHYPAVYVDKLVWHLVALNLGMPENHALTGFATARQWAVDRVGSYPAFKLYQAALREIRNAD